MKRRRIIPIVVLGLLTISAVSIQSVSAYNGGIHSAMTEQAIDILNNMFPGNLDETSLYGIPVNLAYYEADMIEGNLWADNADENPDRKYHFHNPSTHTGLLGMKSAAVCANEGLLRAINCYTAGDRAKAYFWIGFVLHHIQDLTVPAHTDTFDGGWMYHKAYESFCDDYESLAYGTSQAIFTFDAFVSGGKTHCDPTMPFGWVDYAAHQAAHYKGAALEGLYYYCAQDLIPLGVKLSAGFILFAYHQLHPTSDVDGDGLDYTAENQHGTKPWDSDSDGDSMPDGWEVTYGLNPVYNDGGSDMDGDGLKNRDEYSRNCLPNDADSDNDSMPDGWEVTYGLNPLYYYDAYSDTDGDGLKNKYEYTNGCNPTRSDSDGDGLSDYKEVYTYHTKPYRWDTDGDGYSDGEEIAAGTDPLRSSSHPTPPTNPDPIFVPW
jgi:hypothetical protein